MASVVRIEPSLFRADEAWFVFDDGRQLLRKVDREPNPARSTFPCPAIVRDSIEPILAMDGKMTDSLSHYRRTLRADGNPRGETYTEIGNESLPAFKAPEFDARQRRDDIHAAMADFKNGNIPPLTILED
ncbi:MAG: hypothetical protein J7498_05480 [Sphingobium sp.]|nr:hypothetical protein [Sphingobium sp.]